ncbi:MAG: glycosyltransferase [Chloroflexota bacterium]
MRKALLIAYYFPPFGGVGVVRALKFAKYLPEYGWSPIVVSAANVTGRVLDETLAAQVSSTTLVHRVGGFDPFQISAPFRLPLIRAENSWTQKPDEPTVRPEGWSLLTKLRAFFSIPDDKVFWGLPAVREGKRVISAHQVSLIYSTSGPYTSHLAARALKLSTGLPWVADFRDSWSLNPHRCDPTFLHRRLAHKMESAVLQGADLVVTVSERIKQGFLSAHQSLPEHKIIVLPNGFDSADFIECGPPPVPQHQFTVGYFGSLYGRYHDPAHFITALGELLAEHKEIKNSIRVTFTGEMDKPTGRTVSRLIHQCQLLETLELNSYVPHRESIRQMGGMSVLLLIIGNDSRSQVSYTAKLIEYLRAGRPILALVPSDGVAADLINSLKAGIVVPPDDVQEIKKAILSLYRQWQAGDLPSIPRSTLLREFEYRHLTARLAEAFDSLSS